MTRTRANVLLLAACAIAAAGIALAVVAASPAPSTLADPLRDEVTRWSKYLKENPSKDEMWTQLKDSTSPVLARAEEAVNDGRWYLALQRLAPARANLAAQAIVEQMPAQRRGDMQAFEADWKRAGGELASDLKAPSSDAFAGVTPAAVRAIGEAALPQVRVFYDASLEYGRNTMAEAGFFYLASARSQKDFVAFCRSLSRKDAGREPGLRSIAPEIDALEGELLALYRPPASIDRHGEFIGASSTLKEASELDALGLRYGAMLRYLQAALRIDAIRSPAPSLEGPALRTKLDALGAKLDAGGRDDSIGRIFLESAQGDLAHVAAGKKPEAAAAIAEDVLPRYFAALEPAKPRPAAPQAGVTVTLVRWPYT